MFIVDNAMNTVMSKLMTKFFRRWTISFNRAPSACKFLDAYRDVDMWEGSAFEFKKQVAAYVAK